MDETKPLQCLTLAHEQHTGAGLCSETVFVPYCWSDGRIAAAWCSSASKLPTF